MNSVVDRQVPVSVSKAVLPAICLGYILPTALIFLPFQNDFISERLIAFWQFSPVIFAILAFLFAASLKAHDDRKALLQGIQEGKTKNEIIVDQALEVYDNSELNSLKATYAFVFSASALVHVTVVLYSWIDSGKSITTILASFMGLDASMPNPFSGGWDAVGPAESALTIFKFDMLFSAVPLLVFLLYTVWDIRKKGYITTPTAQKVAVAVITGQILVGPAATYAGLWYWRESVIAGLSQ